MRRKSGDVRASGFRGTSGQTDKQTRPLQYFAHGAEVGYTVAGGVQRSRKPVQRGAPIDFQKLDAVEGFDGNQSIA